MCEKQRVDHILLPGSISDHTAPMSADRVNQHICMIKSLHDSRLSVVNTFLSYEFPCEQVCVMLGQCGLCSLKMAVQQWPLHTTQL